MTSNGAFTSPALLVVAFCMAVVAFVLIQRFLLHPLARYPGPRFWILTRFPYMMAFRNGQLCHKLREFHEQYGEVVRVAPNELSYTNPAAIHDIYSKRPNVPFRYLPKDPIRFPPPKPGQPVSILDALDEDHARIRKAWNPSFTTQSLSAQEALVISYVEKLVSQLRNSVKAVNGCVDLQQWYSYCTFDIIGALSFGEDFGCLENSQYHQWVAGLVYSIKGKVQIAACRWYPWLYSFLMRWNTSPQALAAMTKGMAMAREKVLRRLASTSDHPDFLKNLQISNSKHELTEAEIVTNSATLIFAGSHTLQSSLTGLTFLLLKHPDKLAIATQEVRQAYAEGGKFNMTMLPRLSFLNACVQEGFRILSPVPLNMTRLVPEGGAVICGDAIPPGTIVGYMSWAANNSPQNFASPATFAPERWLPAASNDNSQYSADRRDACAPFLVGPRDCLGKNLAKSEILHIMAAMLLNFDMAMSEETDPSKSLQRWEDQKTYAVWTRSPLLVRLTSVRQ